MNNQSYTKSMRVFLAVFGITLLFAAFLNWNQFSITVNPVRIVGQIFSVILAVCSIVFILFPKKLLGSGVKK